MLLWGCELNRLGSSSNQPNSLNESTLKRKNEEYEVTFSQKGVLNQRRSFSCCLFKKVLESLSSIDHMQTEIKTVVAW